MENRLLSLLLYWYLISVFIPHISGQFTLLDFDPTMADCVRYETNGTKITHKYDTCISICCGGFIYKKQEGLACCGSEELGSPYFPEYQVCCKWWTGVGKGHLRPRTGSISCCGAEKITWGPQGCCQGYPGPPEVFDVASQICCQPSPHVASIGNISRDRAKCCGGRMAYDQAIQSCPCDDGQIVDAPASFAKCCRSSDGLTNPYIPDSQICCNGQVGVKDVNFCCGDRGVGVLGEQVCCSGKLVDVEPKNTNFTACCNEVPFDPTVNLCCNNKVVEIVNGANLCCDGKPYNASKSVCCEGSLWSRETQGTECCSRTAYFLEKNNFCCNGDIFLTTAVGGNACCGTEPDVIYYFKDQNQFICCNGTLSLRNTGTSCCGDNPYFPETSICCGGQVSPRTRGDTCCNGRPYFKSSRTICCDNGPFGPYRTPACCDGEGYDIQGGTVCCGGTVFGKYSTPACCVDKGYDASTHSCCGASIQLIPDGGGVANGACCGNNAINKETQLCCGGENTTIPAGMPLSVAKCCNFSIYRTDTQLCCAGVVRERTNQFTSRCCGIETYEISQNICCDLQDGFGPTLHNFTFGNRNTGCCGGFLYNETESICCNGFLEDKPFEVAGCCAGIAYDKEKEICCENKLRQIGKVPFHRAMCCGDKCMQRGVQTCCQGKVYRDFARSTMECQDF